MKLKPCPFCGAEAVIDGKRYCWVKCKNCKAETRGTATEYGAIALWNTRVGDDLMERMEDDGK